MEDYHASYVSVHANPIVFLSENADAVGRINLCLGYRLQLDEAAWPPSARRSEGLEIAARWQNAGVAPSLPGGFPAWSLFNARGELCAVLADAGWNVRQLAPNPSGQPQPMERRLRFSLPPGLAPGEYELRVSVGGPDGTPRLALPLPQDDGHRRYSLGTVRLE
ncbi:MAG: DUF4832 domain-containing protein [Armatimonadetes bacterium]|nr:DUF4832 domain-containing protein [Armatimonadota bacterium]